MHIPRRKPEDIEPTAVLSPERIRGREVFKL